MLHRILAENDAGSRLFVLGSNRKQKQKAKLYLINFSALMTLSYERCKLLCDLKKKIMLSLGNVVFARSFSGVVNNFIWNADSGKW